ncbi:zinc ribbon domain-containing protein [Pectobacteriaceae bacterium CE90]|nr:zinc ribbon domain-containing protein [Prodigiosinella sp. LS101]WJV52793.1 zinc ribbon domain-containing protein [Prodigiosinella sp. LS101]WJV57146.1 zinc ribbon domain-containing protein [Pectobacteriaceae bacterium C111]WJY16190.1 zinc ribbon domain-containing protein [Pectobacteriaceae bacterium CE90]
MEAVCPQCQHEMQWRNDEHFYCAICQQGYLRQIFCPECHQVLQVLKACGAVDYFCQHGHGLISKKQVECHYQPE